MKLFAGLFLLATSAIAQTPIAGTWVGNATAHGQQVPVRLEITGSTNDLHAALLNQSESSPASGAVFTGNHLLLTAFGLLGIGILVMRQLIRRSLAP